MLEEALSRTFAEQAERAGEAMPVPDELADRAIARGRARRRHRYGAALVAACVLAGGVPVAYNVLAVHGPAGPHVAKDQASTAAPPPTEAPAAPPSATRPVSPAVPEGELPVEAVLGHQLRQYDGGRVGLSMPGRVDRAYGASGRYVMVEQRPEPTAPRRVWSVDVATRTQTVMVENATWVAVDPVRERIAWVSGKTLSVGGWALKPGQVRTSPAPATGGPVGFAGDAVVLVVPAERGRPQRYDLWFPDRGDFEPLEETFAAVYGSRRGGAELIVVRPEPEGKLCVQVLASADLSVKQQACDLFKQLPMFGSVSPGGHWLAVGDSTGLRAYEIDKLGPGVKPRAWKLSKLRADPVWLSSDTVVVHSEDRLLVIAMSREQVVTEFAAPAGDLVIVGQ